MVQKRSFDQELNELSSKQPRLVRHCDQLAFLGFPRVPIPFKSHSLGEGEAEADIPFERNFTIDEKFDGRYADDFQSSQRGIPHGFATSSTSEEDVKPECHYYILLSPEHHDVNIARSKIIYSSLIRSPPRKLVPLGPNHQADIPVILGHEKNKTSQDVDWYRNGYFGDDNRFCGTCIIPMPKQDPAGCSDKSSAGTGSGGCVCGDVGSIRCIRQHNFEAREKLRRVLGKETFVSLGFEDMGEVVASRWSEDEQELFHDVVFSNPASLGKNFWDNLAVEFPSRTKKQIVSYYFNVFMLRRRAEQNRFDLLNIDSDNDEWHAPGESSEDEAKASGEDEDLVVESPVHIDDHCLVDNQMVYNENSSIQTNNAVNHEPAVTYFPGPNQSIREWDRVLPKGDYSCNGVVTPQQAEGKIDTIKDCEQSVGTCSSDTRHDLVVEPCNKEWDVGSFGCSPQSRVELLPTPGMIDEVFGDSDWNNYPSRDDGHHHRGSS
ncbi:unnamed protein product [Cuscuta campestris]|uniref:Myb-like domain-containing protein n=1 Tax=Cuscuta campestris TaxID=132261 RepID=A0A484LJ61_9ASTE|nr:unnamed protein product [Cuscuta campestris]